MSNPQDAQPKARTASRNRLGRSRKRFLAGFTAVDLVTIAALAACARITHLLQKFINFAFPLNVGLWYIFFAWALATVMVLVPKRGAASLYAGLNVLAINILIEGDPPQWLITVPFAVVLTELIFWVVERISGNYCTTPTTAVIGLTIAAPVWWLAMVYFGLHIVFATPMNAAALGITLGMFVISAPIVAFLGNKIGRSLKPLLAY
jgi:hypothetical protein